MFYLLGFLILVIVGLYFWYAAIVRARNKVDEALASIDTQFQQRHDLIPNVLTLAKRFLEHESTLLAEITKLRSDAEPKLGERDFARIGDKFQAEATLGAGMTRLFALAENYPALTSSTVMVEAQRTYAEVENNIAAARRFYNSAVNNLKNVAQTFPGPLIATMAGVTVLPPFFEAVKGAEKPINAADYL